MRAKRPEGARDEKDSEKGRTKWVGESDLAVNIRTHAYRYSAAECSRGEGPCASHPEELLEPWWRTRYQRTSERAGDSREGDGTSTGFVRRN